MEQAVPEDYVLAGMVTRAIVQRDGRELEFILKCYLPVVIEPAPFENRSFLIELFGLTNESLTHHKKFVLLLTASVFLSNATVWS